jgi:hypothetical protein
MQTLKATIIKDLKFHATAGLFMMFFHAPFFGGSDYQVQNSTFELVNTIRFRCLFIMTIGPLGRELVEGIKKNWPVQMR